MPDLAQVWEAAALILAFQAASFAWRMAEESRVSRHGDLTWLPIADILNLLAILTSTLGVYVLPALTLASAELARTALGLSTLLYAGHLVSIAAHYELFNPRTKRSMRYFPPQERVAVILVLLLVIAYIALATQA